ncbi:LamG domain-containing protein [Persicobacter psychrovividus]|uniref:LamG-like jellyroll fold domain-containing protein n=1 Tax=Persicobacter psychrovividus TaxID=387638 RepID=A0ABM7VLY1_9BACT|nr:hypothetical protein PEPS_42500 [Persicobacter psychrovividus]
MKNLFFAFIALMFVVAGCSKSDDAAPAPKADKTELAKTIATAQDLYDNAVEGNKEGEYMKGSKDELNAVLEPAKEINAKEDATQAAVDNMDTNLKAAIEVFETKKVQPIAAEDLVAYYTFDQGEGTTVKDMSGNKHDGTFQVGPKKSGEGTVQWAEDHNGEAGKAVSFDKGANITVPYSTLLNPKEITISMWVKYTESAPSNYLISLNRWNGYKFQLQEANKPFFTPAIEPEGAIDKDSESITLEKDTWYQVAVTFGENGMVFYVNGQEAKNWTDAKGVLRTLKEQKDLIIGQDMLSSEVQADDNSTGEAYFRGSMDNIRIYKKVLTAAQIDQIYNTEK